MKKTFEFNAEERETISIAVSLYNLYKEGSMEYVIDRIEQIVSERITPEAGESVKPVPSIPIVGGGSVASDRTEQCESAKEFLSKTTAVGVIERKGVGEYSMYFDVDKLASILTTYASQVCADKDMFIQRLFDQSKDREEYITYAKSELSAANESMTAMLRKNAELLESVRPEVVVPKRKKVIIYDDDFKQGRRFGFNDYDDELRRLNPTMTFTELNHTEK